MDILQFYAAAGLPLPDCNFGTPDWAVYRHNPALVVTDDDELIQSVVILATTILTTWPIQPEKGTRIADYLDRPLNKSAGPLIADIAAVLGTYEPRIKVLSVSMTNVDASSREFLILFKRKNQPSSAASLRATFTI